VLLRLDGGFDMFPAAAFFLGAEAAGFFLDSQCAVILPSFHFHDVSSTASRVTIGTFTPMLDLFSYFLKVSLIPPLSAIFSASLLNLFHHARGNYSS